MPTDPEPQTRLLPGTQVVVRAAGAVLWKPGDNGQLLVAVVHRPRYDDWSLPKGKLDPGETPAQAAVREVTEETGWSSRLSRWLTHVEYPVTARGAVPATKAVDYFTARAVTGVFEPNREVDELRWLTPDKAHKQLTHAHDERVLDAFLSVAADAATILLVRHAHAGKREEFTGDDRLRPLSATGLQQQDALCRLLPLFGVERAYAAPRLRCEQTIAPAAAKLGLDISTENSLSEEGYWPAPHAARSRLLRIAALGGTSVVCSQGGVIPDLVATLAAAGDLDIPEVHSKKGSMWTLTFAADSSTTSEDGSVPRLAAAHYLPDPLQQ